MDTNKRVTKSFSHKENKRMKWISVSSSQCSRNSQSMTHDKISSKTNIKSKREKYNTVNPRRVLKDFKNSASRRILSVKTTFDNISQRFKLTSPKEGKSLDNCYDEFKNDFRTPVKLYSPFGIETPSPKLRKITDKKFLSRPIFFSPTGKLRDDVNHVTEGIRELNVVSEHLKNRLSPSQDK